MKNTLLLSINIGLLVSYIFTHYCHSKIVTYKNELSPELLKIYADISKERMTHFTVGIFIAILVSLIYFFKLSTSVEIFEKVNIILLCLLLIPILVYKVLPKSDYMLKHSQPEQDSKDWFEIYLCMKYKFVYGFLAGFTISMIILSIMNVN